MDPLQKTWLHVACQRSVVKRACRYALLVGAVLVAINHGDALLGGSVSPGRALRIVLTMLVPYGVTTFAIVSAAREALRHAARVREAGVRNGAVSPGYGDTAGPDAGARRDPTAK